MALVEGGAFKCPNQNFETENVKEWNEHGSTCPENHTEYGYTNCIVCGERLRFEGLPFHPFDDGGHKNIALKCDTCKEKREGNVKTAKVYKTKTSTTTADDDDDVPDDLSTTTTPITKTGNKKK